MKTTDLSRLGMLYKMNNGLVLVVGHINPASFFHHSDPRTTEAQILDLYRFKDLALMAVGLMPFLVILHPLFSCYCFNFGLLIMHASIFLLHYSS